MVLQFGESQNEKSGFGSGTLRTRLSVPRIHSDDGDGSTIIMGDVFFVLGCHNVRVVASFSRHLQRFPSILIYCANRVSNNAPFLPRW